MESVREDLELNIDIRTILSDVFHSLWLIIVAAVIGGLVTYMAADSLNEVTYSSDVTFVVSASGSNGTAYNNLSTASRIADVFSEVFSSDALKELVMEDLDMDSFPGTVEASLITETNLVVVRVISDTPENAYKIINSIINNYPQLSDYIFSNAVLDIISSPEVPTTPIYSINVNQYVKYGIIIAAVLMLAVIVTISIFTDTVKTEKAFESKLESNLFATIYHEEKNKTILTKLRKVNKGLLITNPVAGFSFKETFHRISVKLEYMAKSKKYKTFLVTSTEENEGKSTISANIALSLAENGNKVLLIDGDLRKPALYKMFSEQNENVKDMALGLRGEASFKEILKFDEDNNIYLLYNKKGYSDSSELIVSDKMKQLIDLCKDKVDFIIIDSPPVALVSDTEAIIEMVDASLLVVRQGHSLTVNINDVIESLSSSSSELVGCIFNDVKLLFKSSGLYGGYGYYYDKYNGYYRKERSYGHGSKSKNSGKE